MAARRGATVLIEQVRVSGNLHCHMTELWRDLCDISGLAKSKLRGRGSKA